MSGSASVSLVDGLPLDGIVDPPIPGGIPPNREHAELQNLGTGKSILESTIYCGYGQNKAPGLLMMAERRDQYLYCLWCLGFGKLDVNSFSPVLLNDVDITSSDALVSTASRAGVPSSAIIPTIRDEVLGASNQQIYFETYPGLALYFAKLESQKMDSGGLNLVVGNTGRQFANFRGDPEGTRTNPVDIAYDILTSDWPWSAEVDPSDIDTSQWEEHANFCDDDINGHPRFTFNGILIKQDPWKAAAKVLAHAHMAVMKVGNKYQIYCDGDQSVSSTQISMSMFTSAPKIVEAEPGTVLTDIEVAYKAYGDGSKHTVYFSEPAAAGEFSKAKHAMDGFIHAREAFRWGYQKVKLSQERFTVGGEAGVEMADVSPGAIIKMELPRGFGWKNVRITEIQPSQELGKYTFKGRIKDHNVVCGDHVDDDDDGIVDTGWETGTPNAPTNVTISASTASTSGDVTSPLLHVSWAAPANGPRVSHYKIKYGNLVIAKTSATEWSGPTPETTPTFSVYVIAVGIDGTESSQTSSNVISTDFGETTGASGVPYSDPVGVEAGTYYYDPSSGQLVPYVTPYMVGYISGTIPTGSSFVILDPNLTGSIYAAVATVDNVNDDAIPLKAFASNGNSNITVVANSAVTSDVDVTAIFVYDSNVTDMDPGTS